MIRARSVGTMSGSALLGAGRKAGVKQKSAVLNSRGLVGATFEVGPRTSRVLFLTDKSARVLVSIGRSLVTGVAVGTGGRYLEIRKGGRPRDIAIGDEVLTACELGAVPRGLRVGRVVASPYGLTIEPYVDSDRLEFFSILLMGGEERSDLSKGNSSQLDRPEPSHRLRLAGDKANPPAQ